MKYLNHIEKLILFDIDGTIVQQSDIILESYIEALNKVIKKEAIIDKNLEYFGKTDSQNLRSLSYIYGLKNSEFESIKDVLFEEYTLATLKRIRKSPLKLCGGVFELIQELKNMSSIALGLMSGNLGSIAKPKLNSVGIDFATFKVSAFGDDAEHRSLLPPLALKRLNKKYNTNLTMKSVVVIGDTPDDIKAAQDSGAKSIAVATGHYSYNYLKTFMPDYIFKNVLDKEKIKEAVLN